MKNWYGVRLLFECVVAGEVTMYEESIRVLRASSYEEAEQLATNVGQEAEHGYENADGQHVDWRFVKMLEVQDLCELDLVDGTEVFSRMTRDLATIEQSSEEDETN